MIIRTRKKENPFVILDKSVLEDTRLSWKAKGLHSYLMSKKDNWEVMPSHLKKQSKDGRDAVYAALKELEEHGYMHRQRQRGEGGKFKGHDCIVYETPEQNPYFDVKTNKILDKIPINHGEDIENTESQPHTDLPYPEKPYPEKPYPDNPTLVINEYSNKGEEVNNDSIGGREEIYKRVIEHLNKKGGKNYKYTTRATREVIDNVLDSGFNEEDMMRAIDIKYYWVGTKYDRFYRPTTLFGDNFESYINEDPSLKDKKDKEVAKTGFHNFKENHTKYTAEELEAKVRRKTEERIKKLPKARQS